MDRFDSRRSRPSSGRAPSASVHARPTTSGSSSPPSATTGNWHATCHSSSSKRSSKRTHRSPDCAPTLSSSNDSSKRPGTFGTALPRPTFSDRRLATCKAHEIHHPGRTRPPRGPPGRDARRDPLRRLQDFSKTRYNDDDGLYRDVLFDDCDVDLLFDPARRSRKRPALLAPAQSRPHTRPSGSFLRAR